MARYRQRFTILGCGSSPGVPRLNGDWGACDPSNPRNRRTRAAFMVEQIAPDGGSTVVVVDTGPDFREQMIANRVQRVDAVLYTHAHADHLHGIDDLRSLNRRQQAGIPAYGTADTLALNRNRMKFMKVSYVFVGVSSVVLAYVISMLFIHDLRAKIMQFTKC